MYSLDSVNTDKLKHGLNFVEHVCRALPPKTAVLTTPRKRFLYSAEFVFCAVCGRSHIIRL